MDGPTLYAELKRRRVIATAAWYAATSFVALQGADIVVPALHLPQRLTTILVVAALIGFPVVLVLSWFFNITRDRTDVDATDAHTRAGFHLSWSWRLVTAISVFAFAIIAASVITQYSRVGSLLGATTLRCADGSPAPCSHAVPMNPDAYVVLPFADDSENGHGINGDLAARLVSEGLESWNDISIADPIRVNEAMRRHSVEFRSAIPVDSGVAIARSEGAGRLIMGEVWRFGDTTRVRATLYDVASGVRSLRSREVRLADGSSLVSGTMRSLADALLLADTKPDAKSARHSTTSLRALRAYDLGLRLLNDWDLQGAAREFATAVQIDTAFTHARYWLAQAQLWAADTTATWRMHAAQAASQRARLTPKDGILAVAMSRLAARDYPGACDAYRSLVGTDSLNFAAWFGLGDCRAFDRAVVRDVRSKSGFSFRSSFHSAIAAYQHALALVPSFNFAFRTSAVSRFSYVLLRAHTSFRTGRLAQADSVKFAAWPDLEADTLAFVPYPHVQLARGAPETLPQNRNKALERARLIHRDLALEWARSYPTNASAYEALSNALESLGTIAEGKSADASALVATHEAQRFALDADARVRLAVAEVRLLVKAQQFDEAESEASEALERWTSPTPSQAAQLATLAALTGRIHQMASLLQQSGPVFEQDIPITGEDVTPPLPLVEATLKLLAYASFGVPHDSLRVLSERAHRILNAYVLPEQRDVMHAATLERASRYLFFTTGPDDTHHSSRPTSELIMAQRDLLRRDTAAVRSRLVNLGRIRQGWWPGEAAVDGTLTEVQLYLALGDTATAKRNMDALLAALWTITPYQFNQAYQAAALVRIMALRVELAHRDNDERTARRWGQAVKQIWRYSDRDLKPLRSKM